MLSFEERMYVSLLFRNKLLELEGNAFETFFHKVMRARHGDFIDVRVHGGGIGDMGSDGLSLNSKKLYACFGPRTFNKDAVAGIEAKFLSDLAKAIEKRGSEFTTFVFVHNDAPGIHPAVASLLAEARNAHSTLKFERLGPHDLLAEIHRLDRHVIEDLMNAPIVVSERVYGIGLEDIRPLLEHLVQGRARTALEPAPNPVSDMKLDYNRLDPDNRRSLVEGMSRTFLIEEYYAGIDDVTERDEVARNFSHYYHAISVEYNDPDEVIFELQNYLSGNARVTPARERALWVVLAHFFERCDIFENPPPGWSPEDSWSET
ncbi:ABC-three component system protein [Micromonospora inositola]|uniref:ABC-three component systems C-terminal domain-containing protein n=1 Tax=Micromonospora inositola TaxID=47865 RepID=A0A1C5HCC3_9ACTN|nr:ABC-three component system protein [Micromonospora inositola]SCG43678.1 hypothetical protein GA0070613_1122 [Micromonospora inositola]